ncbi:hypothetical protein AKJ09_07555 [Labilithrix luteola]|uniref:Uncharacterized protein n=1 Tax=Labilithrix luteola TaxID=1391654 RepID=A0A0K1Q5G1_9BACT|nr:hypothetical protein AKJ09_07555 [Labilithrix luteola]
MASHAHQVVRVGFDVDPRGVYGRAAAPVTAVMPVGNIVTFTDVAP